MASFKKNAVTLKKQQGDFLIESLVGMVLMAIIGAGVVSVTSKVSVSQRDMNVQTLAISQLRSALVDNGSDSVDICATTPTVSLPSGESVVVAVTGCTSGAHETTTATISDPNGAVTAVAISGIPKPLIISATSSAFSGELVVGGSLN